PCMSLHTPHTHHTPPSVPLPRILEPSSGATMCAQVVLVVLRFARRGSLGSDPAACFFAPSPGSLSRLGADGQLSVSRLHSRRWQPPVLLGYPRDQTRRLPTSVYSQTERDSLRHTRSHKTIFFLLPPRLALVTSAA